MYDVIIIGAGPAGLTAGIYIARAGLKALIIEKETIGGQISSSPLVENYPGFSNISGMELAMNLYNQVIKLGVIVEIDEVLNIEYGKTKKVLTKYGVYESKAVIISTGCKHKNLGIPNEEKYLGKGIHFCATCDGSFYKDKIVGVVGSGNSAITNAIYLSYLAHEVYIFCRSKKLKAELELLKSLDKISNIKIFYESEITKLYGDDYLTNICVKNRQETQDIKIDALFISIGMTPESNFLPEISKSSSDYYISDDTTTNLDGIFVAGDCRQKEIRQLTTASSDGTISALKAIDYLKNLNSI